VSSYQARADFQKLLDALQTTSQVTERTKHSKIPSDCAGDISTYTIEQSVSEIGSRVFASRKDHLWHRIDGVVSVDHEDRVDAIDQHHVPVTTTLLPARSHNISTTMYVLETVQSCSCANCTRELPSVIACSRQRGAVKLIHCSLVSWVYWHFQPILTLK